MNFLLQLHNHVILSSAVGVTIMIRGDRCVVHTWLGFAGAEVTRCPVSRELCPLCEGCVWRKAPGSARLHPSVLPIDLSLNCLMVSRHDDGVSWSQLFTR